MTLVTTTDAAKAFGVSRQAVDQALARAMPAPEPRESTGRFRFYDLDELTAWWKTRMETRIAERRVRPIATSGPTGQIGVRVSAEDFAYMKSIAEPGQSLAAVARMLMVEAIAARKGDVARSRVE